MISSKWGSFGRRPDCRGMFTSRSLTKTLTFLVLHLLVGFSVAYAFTGSLALAGGIALVEPMINAVVFFFHERAWDRERRPALLDVLLHRHGSEKRSAHT